MHSDHIDVNIGITVYVITVMKKIIVYLCAVTIVTKYEDIHLSYLLLSKYECKHLIIPCTALIAMECLHCIRSTVRFIV